MNTTYTAKAVKHAELLGVRVSFKHFTGTLESTVTRVSDSSVWATFRLPSGRDLTLRFTQRQSGAWLQHGKGRLSPVLTFL